MPGQPLAEFKGIDRFVFGPGSVFQRPELAPYVMLVIEEWSFIELTLFFVMANCLKSDPVVATAMLEAVDSQAAQRSAVLAAAKSVLDREHWILFEASFYSILPSRSVRHRFAHHLWGISDQLPDALLLQDPKDMNMERAKRFGWRTIRRTYGHVCVARD